MQESLFSSFKAFDENIELPPIFFDSLKSTHAQRKKHLEMVLLKLSLGQFCRGTLETFFIYETNIIGMSKKKKKKILT